jgi:hypothetical protein
MLLRVVRREVARLTFLVLAELLMLSECASAAVVFEVSLLVLLIGNVCETLIGCDSVPALQDLRSG